MPSLGKMTLEDLEIRITKGADPNQGVVEVEEYVTLAQLIRQVGG